MWTNPYETADLVTFTGEILNEKPHFLCSDIISDSFNFLRSLNDFFSEHGYNFDDVIKIGYTRPS